MFSNRKCEFLKIFITNKHFRAGRVTCWKSKFPLFKSILQDFKWTWCDFKRPEPAHFDRFWPKSLPCKPERELYSEWHTTCHNFSALEVDVIKLRAPLCFGQFCLCSWNFDLSSPPVFSAILLKVEVSIPSAFLAILLTSTLRAPLCFGQFCLCWWNFELSSLPVFWAI